MFKRRVKCFDWQWSVNFRFESDNWSFAGQRWQAAPSKFVFLKFLGCIKSIGWFCAINWEFEYRVETGITQIHQGLRFLCGTELNLLPVWEQILGESKYYFLSRRCSKKERGIVGLSPCRETCSNCCFFLLIVYWFEWETDLGKLIDLLRWRN